MTLLDVRACFRFLVRFRRCVPLVLTLMVGRPLLADDSAPPPGRVWLTDIPETSAQVGYGTLGKHGHFSKAKGAQILIHGQPSPHGIGAHANSEIVWRLDKKYKTLRAKVGINDSALDRTANPLIFTVTGDGAQLWSSPSLLLAGETRECIVDIEGVDELRLAAHAAYLFTDRDGRWGQAVWIEPSLDEASAPNDGLLPRPTAAQMHRRREAEQRTAEIIKLYNADKFEELTSLAERLRQGGLMACGRPELAEVFAVFREHMPRDEKGWKERFEELARWRAAVPKSPIPLLVTASALIDRGWQARGYGYANTVTPEGWKSLADGLNKASEVLDEAELLEPKLAETYVLRLRVTMGQDSNNLERKNRLLDKGLEIDPKYVELYELYAEMAEPRWGGAVQDVVDFARRMKARFKDSWGDQIYARIALSHWNSQNTRVVETTDRWDFTEVRPGLIALASESPEINNWFIEKACYLACLNHDEELARALFTRFGDDDFRGEIWTRYEVLIAWRHRLDPSWPTGKQLKTFHCSQQPLITADFTHDGKRLIVGGLDLKIQTIDIERGKIDLLRLLNIPPPSLIRSVPHKNQAVFTAGVTRPNGALYLLNLDDGKLDTVGTADALIGFAPTQMAVSPDGRWAAASDLDKKVTLWPLVDSEIDKNLAHIDAVTGVAYSPDGSTLATAGENGGLWLWNSATGEALGAPLVEAKTGRKGCHLSFSDDGDSLISISVDGVAQKWDVASRRNVLEVNLAGDGPRRRCQAISPDGRLLASVRRHWPWIELFDAKSLQRLAVLDGHFGEVKDVRFSPDGQQLVSAAGDGDVRLWDVTQYAPAAPKSGDSTPSDAK
jgi:hypothetical protein